MSIVDARVRLPQDQRPSSAYDAPTRQTEQYDKVLGLTDKMNAGTLSGLLKVMDEEDIGRAVMHAESEGGEDADLLNESLRRVLDTHPDRFVGVGCVDIADPSPTALVADPGAGRIAVVFQLFPDGAHQQRGAGRPRRGEAH